MPDVFLILGAAVVKTAAKIWLHQTPFAADLSGPVVDSLTKSMANLRDQRRTRRLFENLEETIADHLETNLGHEFSNVPDNERHAIILAVKDTLESSRLSDEDLFAADLDALFLERHVRVGSPRATIDISARGVGLYDHILAKCCTYIVEVTAGLPSYESSALTEVLRRETAILDGVKMLLDRIPHGPSGASDDAFRLAYIQRVVQALDRIELFGVTLSESVRRYPLNVAYISLDLREIPQADSLHERVDKKIDPSSRERRYAQTIDDALGITNRIFLRGDAGSGKTTLLQWLAIRHAQRPEGAVPFFIPLRQHVGKEFPEPRDFVSRVGRHIADEMPNGWVQRQLRTGGAIVLVDGVDELPEGERPSARRWLRDLIETFPDARYVVTSRPSAAAEDWLESEGFSVIEMQPMAWSDIKAFVKHWHAALNVAQPDEDHTAYEASLLESLHARAHLRALATNPLLCALLCALHRDRRMQIPQDRMELYQVALDMLLERRDSERQIVSSGPHISRTDKTLILQNLAYWLIRNGRSDAPYEQALAEVERCLDVMPRVANKPDQVLKQLLDRSGLIRTPVADRVDFVHRTFQEYLAAHAAVDADDIGALLRSAGDDQWREVIIMAAGHSHPRQRSELLRGLLDRAKNDGHRSKQIRLLAVACLETCSQLETVLQAEIRQTAKDLLPPRTLSDAAVFSKAGDFVLDLIVDNPPRGVRQAQATIRAAAAIGGAVALPVIAHCAHFMDKGVHAELMSAWARFDPREFATRVLRGSPHEAAIGAISEASLVDALELLPGLRALTLHLPEGLGDLNFLRRLPDLYSLSILEDPLVDDLTPVADLSNLHRLYLGKVGMTRLEPLRNLPHLKELRFHCVDALSLSGLRDIRNLQDVTVFEGNFELIKKSLPSQSLRAFALSGCSGLQSPVQLTALRQLDRVEELGVYLSTLETLDGIGCWSDTLTDLSLTGAKKISDFRPLHTLEGLQRLNLSSTPIGDISDFPETFRNLDELIISGSSGLDLSPIRRMLNLRTLGFSDRGVVNVEPLKGVPGLTIRTDAKIIGKNLLGPGSRVVRIAG
jgi:hypothetical protein